MSSSDNSPALCGAEADAEPGAEADDMFGQPGPDPYWWGHKSYLADEDEMSSDSGRCSKDDECRRAASAAGYDTQALRQLYPAGPLPDYSHTDGCTSPFPPTK